MSLIDGLRHRLRALLRRDDYERELDEEIRFHLETDSMHEEHAGRSGSESRVVARRRFGRVTAVKEEARRASGVAFLDVLRQDVRFAFRSWGTRAGRGPAMVTVLTLAVGIGAMTAIYSIVQAILIRPLPVRDPERLLTIQVVMPAERGQRVYGSLVNQEIYRAWKRDASALEGIAGFLGVYRTVTGLGPTRSTRTFAVTANLFEFLGVRPTHGRGFLAEEERQGADPVAVISGLFAERNFGSDTAGLGRTVMLDGVAYDVVGIMPRDFLIPGGSARIYPAGDILTPMTLHTDRATAASAPVDVIARLAPGVTELEARNQLDAILAATALPTDIAAFGKVTQPISPHRMIVDAVRRPLLLLAAGSAVLLLIACANVANVMLARAITRRREIALRTALGAARSRLVRQLLTESLALSILGGSLGVIIAYAALPLIVSLAGNQLPPLGPIAVDGGVLAVAFAATLLVGVLVGVAPAIESRRSAMHASLKEGSMSATPARWTQRTSGALIAAEVGLALVLLTAMGLITRSFLGVMTLDRGYDTEAVLMARIGIPARYDSIPNGGVAVRLAALDRLAAIPGVASVAAATSAPLLGSRSTRLTANGARPTEASPVAELLTVSERYFETLGIPVRHGRAPRVAGEVVLDETAARMLFPEGSPMGRSVAWGSLRRPTSSNSGTGVVVGIVGDLREVGWDDDEDPELSIQPHIYHALSRETADNFAIRSASGDPARLFPAFRAAFAAIDPDITVDIGDSVENMLRGRFARERFVTQLMVGLAGIALFLAAIGIYSVVSYSAERRVREIGIRAALGAARADIIVLMMRRALVPVGIGVIIGIAGSIAGGRLLRRELFEVSPTEPLVLIAATVALCLATVVASYLPSRRATQVDPTMVLREE